MSTHDPSLTPQQHKTLNTFRTRKYFHAADRLLWAYKRERNGRTLRYFVADDEIAIAKRDLDRIVDGWNHKGLHELTVKMSRQVYDIGFMLAKPGGGWRMTVTAADEAYAAEQARARSDGHSYRVTDAVGRVSRKQLGYTPRTSVERKWYATVRAPVLGITDGFSDLRASKYARGAAINTSVHLREHTAGVPCRSNQTLGEWQALVASARKRFLNGAK